MVNILLFLVCVLVASIDGIVAIYSVWKYTAEKNQIKEE